MTHEMMSHFSRCFIEGQAESEVMDGGGHKGAAGAQNRLLLTHTRDAVAVDRLPNELSAPIMDFASAVDSLSPTSRPAAAGSAEKDRRTGRFGGSPTNFEPISPTAKAGARGE